MQRSSRLQQMIDHQWQGSQLYLIRNYASVFRKDGVFHYYIFSKGGFTQALLDAETRGEVTLLTLEDLYR